MHNDVELIELSITEAKTAVAAGDALERLLKNPDFQSLIMEGYCEKEAIRLVKAKSNPNMGRPADQEAVIRGIDGVGSFYQYLMLVDKRADLAQGAINDAEAELAEMADQGEV